MRTGVLLLLLFVGGCSGCGPRPTDYDDGAVPPHDTVSSEATVIIANFVFRPGGATGGNVFSDWAPLVQAMSLNPGYKTLQFDDSVQTPCVVPAGTWDMTQVEWFGYVGPNAPGAAVAVSIGGAPSGGDVILPNLRKIGGEINVTNNNTVSAPVVVPATGCNFELGLGPAGDYPGIINSGAAPFFDCSALGAGQIFLLRLQGALSGTVRAIEMGNSAGVCRLTVNDTSRVAAGMVAGSNAGARLDIFYASGQVNRMAAFSGTITYGAQSTFTGQNPFLRLWSFPASANQAAAAPSTVAFTTGTGLGFSTCLRFDTTAGNIAQTLPQIRANVAIGSIAVTAGALESTGMFIVIKNQLGANAVNLSPAGGETIEGGAGPLAVPAGGSRILMSDGISNWIVIGGYL